MIDKTVAQAIGQNELFSDLNNEEKEALLRLVQRLSYPEQTIIFEENSPRKGVYIVIQGAVELCRSGPFDTKQQLVILGPGQILSASALVDEQPHTFSANSLNPTELVFLERRCYELLARELPRAGLKIMTRIAGALARRMGQVDSGAVSDHVRFLSGLTRSEHDLLGEREVAAEVYFGVQTLRALENFRITGVPISHYPSLIIALAMVKEAAAKANLELGVLSSERAAAIVDACREIKEGKLQGQFVVDVIQGGAGTSTNMNANEVIANRALERMGYKKGEYKHCHPNDHVNLSQSTNDAYPTALKIAIMIDNQKLIEQLSQLADSFLAKARQFAHVIKMGRTQLQDAVPMTLGQEFNAYGVTLREEIDRLTQNARLFLELNMGGTAIGTGINADPRFGRIAIRHLRSITGMDLTLAPNLVEATQDTGAFVMYSSALKRLAIKLSKICNDLRLLSSGPRTGLAEINLPPMQPGSTIMPGKVNPVIPEVVNQIAYKTVGNDLTVTMAAEAGQLELNVMEPLIAQSIFESIDMLIGGIAALKQRCVDGITANEKRCRELVENSIGMVTALNPLLGYDVCTELAKEAFESGRGITELVLEKKLLSLEELAHFLTPENIIGPHVRTDQDG
jgi:aspartate ammonia-lyase